MNNQIEHKKREMIERAGESLQKVIPQIVQEVATSKPVEASAPPATSTTSSGEPAVRSATKRENDSVNLEENISNYLESIIVLRDRYANRLYALLVIEVFIMFSIVILAGTQRLILEQWLVTIVAETILVKTFLTIQIIVKNLFPNKSLFELLVQQRNSK